MSGEDEMKNNNVEEKCIAYGLPAQLFPSFSRNILHQSMYNDWLLI